MNYVYISKELIISFFVEFFKAYRCLLVDKNNVGVQSFSEMILFHSFFFDHLTVDLPSNYF